MASAGLLAALYYINQQLAGQIEIFSERLGGWLSALRDGSVYPEPLVISVLWGLIFWLLAVWASWAIFRRRQPLAAITPAGVILAGSLNF